MIFSEDTSMVLKWLRTSKNKDFNQEKLVIALVCFWRTVLDNIFDSADDFIFHILSLAFLVEEALSTIGWG